MYLCHVTQLPEDGARGFDTDGAGQATIFLLRRGDQVRAWQDSCPHHGTPLPWRRDAYLDASGQHVVCAAHGALFDPLTGVCTLGPCLGDSLTPVALRIDDDGGLHLATGEDDPLIKKKIQETP
ncbi:Rieske 2Fe-2S domain-containing protein [Herbaspirillum huttiense F1]|uniref:Rieske (2Fe-2S) protein n=1 Tax=Herbaspirillum TaxID=963 RepID=UPI001AE12C7E|nr:MULTISPECIES: Rieske 2Fe-2S domain-containing protein [Herbaspirillum]MBP1315274.1 nitrite reductase/ring-hydroxylating ferredoxin subunit [Herbaspirillum sp. 1130]MDT0357469.1 Rieske 2Fe-2S domain-containing protein [Herbaspirillum huttiense F1]